MLQELVQTRHLVVLQELVQQNHTLQTYPIQEASHYQLLKEIAHIDQKQQIETKLWLHLLLILDLHQMLSQIQN